MEMAAPASPPTRLLVVDDDSDLRPFLRDLLTEEGYAVDTCASLDEALALLDARIYHLIITDLLAHSPTDPLRTAITLRDAARPTPVATLTGWTISVEEVERAGLARLIAKPFDLNDFITIIADCVEVSYSPEQQCQAETLGRLCAAFDAGNVAALMALCVPDVRAADILAPPAPGAQSVMLIGQAAVSAALGRLLATAPETRLDDYLIYPQASGLALRFVRSWRDTTASGGRRATQATSALFQFQGERISEIRLLVGDRRWNAVVSAAARVPGQQARPL